MTTSVAKMFSCILLILCFFIFLPATTQAADYYIATSGSDSNPGTSTSPWRSLSKALSSSNDNDTVNFKAGTYDLGGYSTTLSKTIHLKGESRDNTIFTNGGSLTLKKAITIENLTFQNYSDYVLRLSPSSGESINGLRIEKCKFNNVGGVFVAESYSGLLTNITVNNNIITKVNNSGRTSAFRISSGGSLATRPNNIKITNNYINDIYSRSASADVLVIYFGENSTATNRFDFQPTNVLIQYNEISNIRGGVSSGSYNPGGRGVLMYGSYFTIDSNYIHDNKENPPTAEARNCVYIKGAYSTISNNVVHNCASGSAGSGSGDINIKGDFSTGNKIIGNHITSDSTQTLGGFGIYTKGGVTIENNYVKKTNGASSTGIFSFEAMDQAINVLNNRIEVGSLAVHIWGANTGTVKNNLLISYNKSPTSIPSSFSISGNVTCTGTNCSGTPPVKNCTNSGYFCSNSCASTLITALNSTCTTNKCCSTYSLSGGTSTPPPQPLQGDINGDGKVNIIDIGILIDNYALLPIVNKKTDVNNDGRVDIVDLGILIDNYSI